MVAVPSGQLILVVPFELTIRVVLPSALISFEEPSGLVITTVPSAFVSFFITFPAFIAVPSRAILYLPAPSDYFSTVFTEPSVLSFLGVTVFYYGVSDDLLSISLGAGADAVIDLGLAKGLADKVDLALILAKGEGTFGAEAVVFFGSILGSVVFSPLTTEATSFGLGFCYT